MKGLLEKNMKLYLMQHGNAVSKEENPAQPLSEKGRKDVESAADFICKAGIQIPLIFHSNKTRAKQTAEIIAARLISQVGLNEKKGLAPLDEIVHIAKEIEATEEDRMLVSHLPFLAKLSSYLIAGDESLSIIQFQQGGLVCLQRNNEGNWVIEWMVPPLLITINRG